MSIKSYSVGRTAELRRMLARDPEILVDSAEADGKETVGDDESEPEVLVWEPESIDDIELDLLDEQVNARALVVIADSPSSEWVVDALRAGVKAVLPAEIAGRGLIAAIRTVEAGLIVSPGEVIPDLSRRQAPHSLAAGEPLTARELEVLSAMAEGLTNREIASRLEISEHTAKFHVATILSKTGAASRTEAVTLAIRQGMLTI